MDTEVGGPRPGPPPRRGTVLLPLPRAGRDLPREVAERGRGEGAPPGPAVRASGRRLLGILPALLAASLVAPATAPAAGPPEVVRVRVPAARVPAWFPPGTELRGLPRDEFEDLVRAATAGHRRAGRRDQPRLLRARHEVRWRDGRLFGRSELLIEGAEGGPGTLALVPWTPAIAEPPACVFSGADGRTAIRVEPGKATTSVVAWELRPRPGSGGRTFALGLPKLDATTLLLAVPEGWIPEGPAGVRQGPDPASEPSLRAWRFDGPGGWIDLRLRAAGGRSAVAWVGGQTRVELDDGAGRWRADWTIDPGVGGPRQLAVQLDPGLEPIDVTGEGVVAFRAEPSEGGMRVTIRLGDEVNGPTPVAIRARAFAPAEGRWAVPAARPIDALWTGGETVVHLGPARALEDCRERAGRRVPPPSGDGEPAPPPPGLLLAFDASRPASVAELVFARPSVAPRAEVRGQLALGDDAPRFEALVTWHAAPGPRADLAVDLPPGWSATKVRPAAGADPISWRAEGRPGGRSRVVIHPPPGADPAGPLALILSATGPSGRGPWPLPRALPVEARLADELWTARADRELTIRPARARGLAWLDPALLPPDPAPPLSPADPVLAWRWTDPDAEAEVACERVAHDPTFSTRTVARLEGGRLRLDWRIETAGPGGWPRSLCVALDEPLAPAPEWRAADEGPGAPVPARPLDRERRAALGLPERGAAWELDLTGLPKGQVVLQARSDRPWSGRGPIPLVALPDRLQARGTVLVAVDRAMRSEAEVEGLRALDADLAWRAAPGDGPGPARLRPAHAFRYRGAAGRLVLRTEELRTAPAGGLIREATLTTVAPPDGPTRRRLRLLVEPAGARELAVTLPAGSAPERVLLDGQVVAPTRRADGAVGIPLPPPRASRPSCAIVLESAGGAAPAPGLLRPEPPGFSMPCLALSWEVARPGPWAAEGPGPSFTPADPTPPATLADRIFGRWPRPWSGRTPAAVASALAELDDRVAAARCGEVTLRDWFASWDAGRRPLVVDRAALASAGWGPDSRTIPVRARTARGALEPLGLTVVPLGGVDLITSRAEAPDRPGGPLDRPDASDAWAHALWAAVGAGSGPADRFQSIARWRGEATPAGPGGAPPGDGWEVRRFVAPGWPETGGELAPADLNLLAARGGILGLSILVLGVAFRKLPPRARAYGAAAVVGLALAEIARTSPRPSTWAIALDCGAFAAVAFWLGRALRPPRAPARGRGPSSTPSRSGRSGPGVAGASVLALALALAAGGMIGRVGAEAPDADAPILALIPLEDAPGLADEGPRVVLRLADHDRLRAWAEAGREPPAGGVGVTAAVHRVGTRGDDRIVESRLDLRCEGPGPWAWRIPVGEARDLAATLDGRAAAVLVQPGGQDATVALDGAGRHELIVRRVVDRRRGGGPDGFALPINPVASARFVVEAGTAPGLADVPTARGAVEDRPGGVAGTLGPADRLEVRWSPEGGRPDRAEAGGSVEGALLWDAVAAGDRVRARLTFRKPGGTATVRLALEPGVAVRSNSTPSLIDAQWEGTVERPVWVGRLDPPLGAGEFLAVELWRPAAPDRPGGEARRRLPRIEPVGVERCSGVLGLRRPGDWAGRLGPLPGTARLADEAFVAAWGELPRERLTLAGATRFDGVPAVVAEVAPTPARVSARQAVELQVVPGRIDVAAEATLTALSGRPTEVACRIPEALRLVHVEAGGLTHWSRPAPDLLRLRFDGAEAVRTVVRLRGWLPTESDPLRGGGAGLEAAIPWPAWIDAEAEPGTLAVESSAPFRMPQGRRAAPIAPAGLPKAGLPFRQAYRVEGLEGLGPLRWSAPPPRVDVAIRSLLTVHPGSAEWSAEARYRVAGGPCDVLRLKLSGAWAAAARMRVEGARARVASEQDAGGVVWTIRPEAPAWGPLRVLVQADRPLARGGELDYPDLVPLGLGTVETLLALADASGWGIVPGGSPGLQPAPTGRFPQADFPEAIVPPGDVFLVKREGWSLRIRAGEAPAPGEAADGGTCVDQADLTCVVAADGAVLGEAAYELRPRPGPFLTVALPAGAEAVGAAVDGAPVAPLRWSGGRWSVPLGRGGLAGRVALTWRRPAPREGRAEDHSIAIPGLAQAQVPTRLRVYAPEAMAIEAPAEGWQPVGGGVLEVDRAERMAWRLAERLGDVDRGSRQGREALVAALVEFELLAREADRAIRWRSADRDSASLEAGARLLEARSGLAEALGAAGLDDPALEARERVGLAPPRSPLKSAATAPAGLAPLRRPGRPHEFRSRGADPAPAPRWSVPPPPRPWDRAEPWRIAAIGLAVLAAAHVLSGIPTRPLRAGVASAALPVLLLALGVEPTALVALLAMAGLGWATGG